MATSCVVLTALVFVYLTVDVNAGSLEFPSNRLVKTESNKLASSGVFVLPVSSRGFGANYETNILIGSSQQVFRVLVDTGSPYTWVLGQGFQSIGSVGPFPDKSSGVYNPSASRSFKGKIGEFNVPYGKGKVIGLYLIDVLALGSKTHHLKLQEPMLFGAGHKIQELEIGMLGLSFLPKHHEKASVFASMHNQGLIKQSTFTIFFKRCQNNARECNDSGRITFGGRDTENCANIIEWIPLIPTTMEWVFETQGVAVNHHKVHGSINAMSDTGSSFVHFPTDMFRNVIRHIQAHTKQGAHFVLCRHRFNITIHIHGKDYVMHEKELTAPMDGDYCRLLIGEYNDGRITLGQPWIRSFCQVHMWKASQLSRLHKRLQA